MSADGCWKCGVRGHHSRDCTAGVEKGSAALVHADARRDHRSRCPTPVSKTLKWNEWQKLRMEAPPPVCVLSKFVNKSTEYLKEKGDELDEIGIPTVSQISNQLRKAEILQQELRIKFPELREIVLLTKNYFAQNGLDARDQILHGLLSDLDNGRQPLMTKVSIAIADMKEIMRQQPRFESLLNEMLQNLQQCEDILGERSPTLDAAESANQKIQTLLLTLVECQKLAQILDNLLCNTECSTSINQVEARLTQLQLKRKQIMQEIMREARENADDVLCPICLDAGKEFAMPCGHQLCGACLQQLMQCPFCGSNWNNAIPLRLFSG